MNNDVTPVFIPGAGRAGTTYLMELISSHQTVCACAHKEPCYFDRNFYLGEEFYRRLFKLEQHHYFSLEASTNYLWYPEALERIAKFNPKSKFVISLRNPGSRAFGEYARRIERNGEDRTFPDVFHNTGFGKKRSAYVENLKRIYTLFPAENINVVIFENWISDPTSLVHTFSNFLGVEHTGFEIPPSERNKSSVPISKSLQKFRMRYFFGEQADPKHIFYAKAAMRRTIDYFNHLCPHLRNFPDVRPYKPMLYSYYQKDIDELETLLNLDLTIWRDWYENA